MRRPGAILLGLATTLLAVAACASGGRGSDGPVVSPTGKVYEPGIPPDETRFSQTSSLYLRRGRVRRALELAQEGVVADPQNPIHYYLAGLAHARLDQHVAADRMFDRAESIYPAYELDIEPEREAAWGRAFNAGTEAYNEGDLERAIEAWRRAIAIYDLRPEAHRNLASVLSAEGRYEEAIQVYEDALEGLEKRPATRVLEAAESRDRREARTETEERLVQLLLFRDRYEEAVPLLRRQLERDSTDVGARSDLARALDGMGRKAEATEIYTSLLSESGLESTELLNLGVALFRTGQHGKASDAFERLTRLQPNSRDAWYNYANALFAAEEWERLARIGDRLVELDPLGESTALVVARARLESGDEEGARRGVERSDGAPVHVGQLQMQPSGGVTRVRGRVVGNQAEAGTPVRLRFTFYGEDGALGSETVTVSAPSTDESAPLEVSFGRRAVAYRYEVLR